MSLGIGSGLSMAAPTEAPASLGSIVAFHSGYYFDFRTTAGYTLGSGSNVDAIIELVTGTSIVDGSAPAQRSLTGLDGGPCITFNGTTHFYPTTLPGLVAVGQNDAPYTAIALCGFDSVDDARSIATFYDNGGNAIRGVGQASGGAGTLRYRTVTDAGSGTSVASTNAPPDTNGHKYRYEISDAGSTLNVRFYVDGVADPANPVSSPKTGSSLIDTFSVGGSTQLFDGRLAVLVLIPGAPNSAVNAAIEAAI